MANDIFSLLTTILIVAAWTVVLVNEFNGRLTTALSSIVDAMIYVLSMIGLIAVLSATL